MIGLPKEACLCRQAVLQGKLGSILYVSFLNMKNVTHVTLNIPLTLPTHMQYKIIRFTKSDFCVNTPPKSKEVGYN